MFKLLVIDDEIKQEKRKSVYQFMFEGEFETVYTSSQDEELKENLKKMYFDCIILDNNLDEELDKDEVIKILSTYGYPIIMLSNVRRFSDRELKKDGIVDFIALNLYFSLREDPDSSITKQALKDLRSRITHDIYISRKYSNIKDKSDFTICHLSDIQFCDPHIEEHSLRTFFSKLEEFILSRDKYIDLVVITGDVVFSGKEKEFKVAKESINKFIDKIQKNQMRKMDIVFVPGNHDFDYKCFLVSENTSQYKISEEGNNKRTESFREISPEQIQNLKITPDYFDDFKAESIYLSNFKKFAYEITKDYAYFLTPFYIEKTNYLNKGFKLIGVSNAFQYHKNIDGTKRYSFELDSDLIKDVKKPLNSIVLGHVDPRSLGYKTVCANQEDRCSADLFRTSCKNNGQCELWGDMQRLFLKVNGILYLYGHTHCSDIEISDDKKTLFVGAASSTGANPSEKTINIIELKDIQDKISAKISVHRAKAENISFQCSYNYTYYKETEEWKQNERK